MTPPFSDATALLSDYTEGRTTPAEERVRRLELIAGRGAELNAIVDLDREASTDGSGALGGVPMTIKDSFDVRGLRTTAGVRSDGHRAADDAPAVARLRSAGAMLLGKTNVPVLLDDYQSVNADFGRTLNPWNATRTPGGSSGGSAAAVAAGLALADLGSDLGGSIRMPAAWCGVFGHRPSNGIVSKMGHLPWPVDGLIEPPASVSGPLARSARDLLLLMDVLVGPARLDARSWAIRLPPARVEALHGLRVGLWWDDPAAPIEHEMRIALERIAADLEGLGAQLVPIVEAPTRGREALDLYDRITAAEIAHSIPSHALPALAAAGDPIAQSAHDAWRDAERQRVLTQRWDGIFETVDVVLSPAVPGAAPEHSDVPKAQRMTTVAGRSMPAFDAVSAWSRLTNLARLPATIVPLGLGRDTGLPLGAALVGAYLDDRTPLRVAALLEREGVVRFEAPPGW